MSRAAVLVAVALAALAAMGADCGGAGGDQPIPCHVNGDCPGTLLCLAGVCGYPAGVACHVDADCPTDFICLENGRCRANTECQVDTDCCADASSCTSTCTDFHCIGTACTTGDAEDCFVGCHRGQRTCANGNWTLCDALPVGDEVCGDNEDNDCNGTKDDGCAVCTPGDVQACDAPCGSPGSQTCAADGTWGACDSADGCACTPGVDTVRTIPCGNCGSKDSSCGADGFWADSNVCQSEGECAPGAVDTVACGNCGQQTRTCDDTCTFGAFDACTVPANVCTPGDVITESCGTCGTQTRTCDASCQLGAPSTCDENAGCSLGDTQTVSCGKCGTQTATCDNQCTFGAFGTCQGEGVCSPGEVDVQSCGNCGTRSRTCGSGCTFGVFGACTGEGECAPGAVVQEACGPTSTQGICRQGTHTKTCNAQCRFGSFTTCNGAVFPSNEICGDGIDQNCDGFDDSLPDQFEFNDTCGSASLLGDDPNITIQPTWDSILEDADDYFFFHGHDSSNPFVTEHIKIDLTNIPAGMDLDLTLYKTLANCASDTALASSLNGGNAAEHIDFAEQVGPSDDGDYFVRVHPFSGSTANCFQPYSLTVNGLN